MVETPVRLPRQTESGMLDLAGLAKRNHSIQRVDNMLLRPRPCRSSHLPATRTRGILRAYHSPLATLCTRYPSFLELPSLLTRK